MKVLIDVLSEIHKRRIEHNIIFNRRTRLCILITEYHCRIYRVGRWYVEYDSRPGIDPIYGSFDGYTVDLNKATRTAKKYLISGRI